MTAPDAAVTNACRRCDECVGTVGRPCARSSSRTCIRRPAPGAGVVRARPGRGAAPPPDVEVELCTFAPGAPGYARALRALRALRRRHGRRFDVVHAHFGLTAWPAHPRPARRADRRDAARQRPLPPALEPHHARGAPVHDAARRGLARVQRQRPRRRARRGASPCCRSASTSGASGRIPREEARRRLGLDPAGRYLLFPHDPARPLKRADRAREVAGEHRLLIMGRVPPEEVPYWINASNAVLVPSQDEGFGLSVLEALACDVPAFGTPVGIHPIALERHRGRALRAVRPRRLARGAGAAPARRGPARRGPFARRAVLQRPHGRPRRRGLAGDRGCGSRVSGRLYSAVRGPQSRPGEHERPVSTHSTHSRRRRRGEPDARRRRPASRRTRARPPSARAVAHCWSIRRRRGRPRSRHRRWPRCTTCRRGSRSRSCARRAWPPSAARGCAAAPATCAACASCCCATSAAWSTRSIARPAATGADQESLVRAKAERLAALDSELFALEKRLGAEHPETVLREPGVGGACPSCGELHASDARFCSACGTPLAGRAPVERRTRAARRGAAERRAHGGAGADGGTPRGGGATCRGTRHGAGTSHGGGAACGGAQRPRHALRRQRA